MKRKFSFSSKGKRRGIGQTIAVAVMALAVAFSGASTTALFMSQPTGLTVASSTFAKNTKTEAPASEPEPPSSEARQEQAASSQEPETTVTVTSGSESAASEPEVKTEAPAASGEETAAEETAAVTETAAQAEAEPEQENASAAASGSGKMDVTAGNIDENNSTGGAVFRQETPELAAEDPLSAPETAEAAQRAAEAAGEDNPLMLTPEQVEQALEEGGITDTQQLDLTDENCLKWLWNLLFGSWGDSKDKEETYSGWRTDADGYVSYYDPDTHVAYTGVHSIDGVLYYFNENGIKQDVTFGIDVSKYQSNIDWSKVKSSGVEFVMIRIGYRGYSTGTLVEDPMFESHYAGATGAGLRVGAYAFSQAINENEAREEAQACVYVLNGRHLDYPIYFDSEAGASNGSGRADGLGKADRTKCAVAFCEEVKSLGYKAGVYASTRWFNSRLDMSQLKGYSIWNAHYNVAKSSIDCDVWQGSCECRINGYSGQIDVNVSYIG